MTIQSSSTKAKNQNSCRNYYGQQILCTYTNATQHIQIVRLLNSEDGWFERVVLPHQSLVFEARPEEYLDVYTSECITMILSERIRCDQLQVPEEICNYSNDVFKKD